VTSLTPRAAWHAAWFGVLALGSAQAQAPARVLRIPRVAEPPRREAFLPGGDGGGGQISLGVPVTDWRQREPGDGAPGSAPTTAYLSYDADNLYVVFVCRDEPGRVRAGLTKREGIAVDDGVGVYLDTFHDHKRAYLFQTNPLGVQLDGIVTDGQDDDYSFDTVWQSEGWLTDDGYVVRIAIPFRSLRFPRTATQTWGIALARFVRRTNEELYWPYVTKRVAGFVPQLATLEGLRDISPGRNLQAMPYGAFTGARFLDADVPAFRTARDRRLGLDAKAVLKDALTFDGTINPDFSQVESDEPQVTINERFETFFPEKRPFFIENAGYFQTPVDLMFSRRIADPGGGLRLTGKAGPWALGAIAIDDRTPEELSGGAPPYPRAGIGVVRAQRELGRESAIGVLLSDRQVSGAANRVASADARLAITKTWIFTGQVMATHVRDTADAAAGGAGMYARLEHDGRNLDYSAQYVDLGSAFEAQLGYVPRVGIRQVEQQLELVRRPHGPLVKIGPTFSTAWTWDRSGSLLDRKLKASWEVKLVRETKLALAYESGFESFDDLPFDTHAAKLSLDTQWLKWLVASASYKVGTSVNHKPPSGVAPFLADGDNAELTLTFRPASRLQLDHTYLYSRLTTRPGGPPLGGAPLRVFSAGILREKLNYQFSRVLSLRLIVDYEAVRRDSTLSRVSPARHWTADVLLTCLVTPGTALYVGYRDGYENLALAPGSPPTLYRTDAPTTSVGRQLFAKLSYLLRF